MSVNNLTKRIKSCLYVGYRSCVIFLHHFEKSVDFLAKKNTTVLFHCHRIVEDIVVNFRIEKVDWEILKGFIVFTSIRSTSDFDHRDVPDDRRFAFTAKVKSVELDIVFSNAKLFTDHVGNYDAKIQG